MRFYPKFILFFCYLKKRHEESDVRKQAFHWSLVHTTQEEFKNGAFHSENASNVLRPHLARGTFKRNNNR